MACVSALAQFPGFQANVCNPFLCDLISMRRFEDALTSFRSIFLAGVKLFPGASLSPVAAYWK
jgi:hypothetical protein